PACTLAHGSSLLPSARRRAARRSLGLAVGTVPVEHPRRRELPELVTDHFLGHQHRYMFLPVVDAEIQADELRQDGRAAAPDLDHLVTAGSARGLCLLEQIAVNERALPQ